MAYLNSKLRQKVLSDYLRTSVLNDASNNYIVFSRIVTVPGTVVGERATIAGVVSNTTAASVVPVMALRTAVARMYYAIKQSDVSSQPSGTASVTYNGISYWAKAFSGAETGNDMFDTLIIESAEDIGLNSSEKVYNSVSLVSGTSLANALYEEGAIDDSHFSAATILVNQVFSVSSKTIPASTTIDKFVVILKL